MLLVQRFRQEEQCDQEVHEGKPGREIERHARPERAEQSAKHRADDEAAAESDAEQAKILGPVLVIRNVGDEGGRRRMAGAGNAGEHPSDEQHRVGPGDGADQVVDRKGEHRGEQDRPPPETVAQAADDRREEELHRRIDEEQPAALDRRVADADAGKFLQIGRQHRHDDAEADHVEQQRGENEHKAPLGGPGVDHGDKLLGRPGAKAEGPYRRACRPEQ